MDQKDRTKSKEEEPAQAVLEIVETSGTNGRRLEAFIPGAVCCVRDGWVSARDCLLLVLVKNTTSVQVEVRARRRPAEGRLPDVTRTHIRYKGSSWQRISPTCAIGLGCAFTGESIPIALKG